MKNLIRRLFLFIFAIVCACIIIFCFIMTVWTVGPRIETALWPVTSKLTIVSLKPSADGLGSELTAQFRKYRDCDYIGITWYRGNETDGFMRVPTVRVKPTEPLPRNPVGVQTAGPWEIKLTNDEILHDSFAILTHSCHPFWVTTTYFFP